MVCTACALKALQGARFDPSDLASRLQSSSGDTPRLGGSASVKREPLPTAKPRNTFDRSLSVTKEPSAAGVPTRPHHKFKAQFMFKKIVLAVTLLASAAAQAETFDFSYVFPTIGTTVSGSFDGTRSGDLVTGLSNIRATYQNVVFAPDSGLHDFHYNGKAFVSGGSVASFSGNSNNFLFVNSETPDDLYYKNFFFYIPYYGGIDPLISTYAHAQFRNIGADNSAGIGTWALKSVSAVPEPEVYAMLLAGLGLMGTTARRRKEKQTQ